LKGIPIFEGEYGKSRVVRELTLDESLITDYDQILCNTNKYRVAINDYIRKTIKGYPENRPVIGDKVVCCQNNWEMVVDGYPLTNGMIGYISDISRQYVHKGYYLVDFEPDFLDSNKQFRDLKIDAKYINASYTDQKSLGRLMNEKFEYGYAITVYKSQGSEFNRVLYFDSFFRSAELTKRSRYTAITRARESLTIVLNEGTTRMW
jgi:exodeoxyribonuclease-5